MSSRIVAAVPNSLLMNKSRSGSRSKSSKQKGDGGASQPTSSSLVHKGMAGMKGVTLISGRDPVTHGATSHSIN